MTSVMQQIRDYRANAKKERQKNHVVEAVVEGCAVKMRFSEIGDDAVMPRIQDALLSSYCGSISANISGGEGVH